MSLTFVILVEVNGEDLGLGTASSGICIPQYSGLLEDKFTFRKPLETAVGLYVP